MAAPQIPGLVCWCA